MLISTSFVLNYPFSNRRKFSGCKLQNWIFAEAVRTFHVQSEAFNWQNVQSSGHKPTQSGFVIWHLSFNSQKHRTAMRSQGWCTILTRQCVLCCLRPMKSAVHCLGSLITLAIYDLIMYRDYLASRVHWDLCSTQLRNIPWMPARVVIVLIW